MILKTYARVFTHDMAATLPLFEQLVGGPPDIRFVFGEWERIFKNPMTTAAAIDRLVHHSVILEFGGRSKRADEAESRAKPTTKEERC